MYIYLQLGGTAFFEESGRGVEEFDVRGVSFAGLGGWFSRKKSLISRRKMNLSQHHNNILLRVNS